MRAPTSAPTTTPMTRSNGVGIVTPRLWTCEGSSHRAWRGGTSRYRATKILTILVAFQGTVKRTGSLPFLGQEAADAVDQPTAEPPPAEARAEVGYQGLGIDQSPVGQQASPQGQGLLGLDLGVHRGEGRCGRPLLSPPPPARPSRDRVRALRAPGPRA